MLTFRSNCKLGVQLQSAFAVVMVVFVAAVIGIFVSNAKREALGPFHETAGTFDAAQHRYFDLPPDAAIAVVRVAVDTRGRVTPRAVLSQR